MRPTLALAALALLFACNKGGDTEDTTDPSMTDADGDGIMALEDCDDNDPNTHPFADEVCDGKDNDCDGKKDNDAVDAREWWQDADEDGYGDPSYVSIEACDQPGGYVDNGDDCDDTDAAINPELEWFADVDADGFGDPDSSTQACLQPTGYVVDATDCDDEHYNANPGASEYCDGYDNDCDGTVDEDDARNATEWYQDDDGDGYGDPDGATLVRCDQPAGMVDDDTDCDDDDDDVFPGSHATEVPGDGVDTDCDGRDFCTDLDCDGLPDVVFTGWSDGDGYEVESTAWLNADGWASAESLSAYGAWVVDSRDMDGDGYVDLVFGSYEGDDAASTTSWLFSGGASGFSGTGFTTAGVRGQCVADFDADGNADVFWSNHVADGEYDLNSGIYWGPDLSTSTDLPTHGAWGCGTADIDGDAIPDIAVSNFVDGETGSHRTSSTVFLSGSSFDYESATTLNTIGATGVLMEDVDSDGYADLVYTAFKDGGNLAPDTVVFVNTGSGFDEGSRYDLPTEGALDAVTADMNNDGYLDLAFPGYHSNTGGLVAHGMVYYGSRSGFSRSDRDQLETLGATDVLAQDLDGDGFVDLVFANSGDNSGSEVDSYVYWGAATGYSSADRTDLPTDGAWAVAAADLDEDGHVDLVFACQGSAVGGYEASSLIYWGDAAGYTDTDVTELPTTGASAVIVVGG